ncbi:MAG TPA: ribulose-phosphate 3-epimerase [Terriglobales bacterium]|jgi:ribulose-phosphate 3-epimerase
MKSAPHPRLQLVPSILSADFNRLGAQIADAAAAGADRFQIDIMDGHFVPNISMGPMFVAAARRATRLPLEAHLMVSRPEQWLTPVAEAGADTLIVHAEATVHLHRLLVQIAALGKRPAVALNPASPLELIHEVLEQATMVLLMTVEPGFGGQPFIASVLDKIRRLRRRYRGDIEVDGGVEPETIALARDAGANVFVAGSSVFGHPSGPASGLAALRQALTRTSRSRGQ